MSAYVLVDVDVNDPERYETYKPLAHAAITRYGGRYLARGGETAILEGDWTPGRVVVLEFPTHEAAVACYRSPEYQDAVQYLKKGCDVDLIIIAGYDGPQP